LRILWEGQLPAIESKTWTTDSIYRETYRNKELRKEAGCIAVEIECASVMAMAQFIYTADNLDCKEWEPHLLENMPQNIIEKYVRIALEVSIRL
jgi:purine-nucleoside phosphorylase